MDEVIRAKLEELDDTIEGLAYEKTGSCDLTAEQKEEINDSIKNTKERMKECLEEFSEELDYIMSKDFLDEIEEAEMDPYKRLGIDYNSYFGGV